MSTIHYRNYQACIRNGRPYFGRYLQAFQGLPIRHAYMWRLLRDELQDCSSSPIHVLEVGSWAGGSAITWADALIRGNEGNGQIICVDPWESYFDPEQVSDPFFSNYALYQEMSVALASGAIFDLFMHNVRAAGFGSLILPFRGPSGAVLPLLAPQAFDLVFVDGAHDYSSVAQDLRSAMPLVKDGGILCGDDLDLQLFEVEDSIAYQQRDRDFIQDPRTGDYFHPGVTVAVAESLGRVTAWKGFWAMRKNGDVWTRIENHLPPLSAADIPEHIRSAEPILIEQDYHGFRILAFAYQFFALRVNLGHVDIASLDDMTFDYLQSQDHCVVSASLSQLKQLVQSLA